MRVELRLGGLITVNGRKIALGQTFTLLDGIARERSVRAAAERLGVSYRAAWGRVAATEAALGRPLVTKTKGHGSTPTELGLMVRDALRTTLQRFEMRLAEEQQALERTLSRILDAPTTLRLALSHDPLLLDVLAAQPQTDVAIDVAVVGSAAAVERLRAGSADAAGFHFGPGGLVPGSPFAALFDDPALTARPVFRRQQGLIVAPGNPLAIRSVADLARARVRFVNRQRGSGTRLWFDALIARAGIEPKRIAGYGVEEFTHQAVAAVIASGAADAGMGARAVADRFGLGFVPIGEETYYLATRIANPAIETLLRAAGAAARRTTGYRPIRVARRSLGRG